MKTETYIFFIFILLGFLIGILFDFFRVLRKSFKTKDIITYFEDILFWIFSGFGILYVTFKFNNGELRGFTFLGMAIGCIIYGLLFSKIFIKVNVYIINLMKKGIYFLVIKPIILIFYFLKNLLKRPIHFIFVNIRKIMSKINIKKLFLNKKNKRKEFQKDFI